MRDPVYTSVGIILLVLMSGIHCYPAELLTNGSIEELANGLPVDWDFRRNEASGVNTDPAYSRTGNNSLKFDLSLGSDPEWNHRLFPINADSIYRLSGWYQVEQVISTGSLTVYVRWWPQNLRANLVSQEAVKTGIGSSVTPGWVQVSEIVVPPAGANYGEVIVYSVASGPQGLVFMDDFSFMESWIERNREPRPYATLFPKSVSPPVQHLYVFDQRFQPFDMRLALSTLQGLINRKEPRLYLINVPYDPQWLEYMQEKGHTGQEIILRNGLGVINQFKGELAGKIIYDPALPGSIHAACMMGSVLNAMVVSPDLSPQIDLPVLEDLRGRWMRNVDAYRHVYAHYWNNMNHHFLASVHPLSMNQYVRDYLVAFNVFTFWLSSEEDEEVGASPAEERIFINELFANTPSTVPIWGWFSYGDAQGISEYEGVKWASKYGKFLPGTEFSSNLTIHSGITVSPEIFQQRQVLQSSPRVLESDKIYVCLNLLDSGDSQWYWQFRQREVWEDPERGHVPIGWSLNPTVLDSMPLVLQWYYENATPMDYIFSAQSGIGYMFTTHFAEVFNDRDAAWEEFIQITDEYCRKLDLQAVEMYNGGWGAPTPPSAKILSYYTKGIKNLRALFPDFGRHDVITGDNSHYLFDNTAVFHCNTRFNFDFPNMTREQHIQYAVQQILDNAPSQRPGFMNAMMLSWTMYPGLIREVAERLPPHFVPVTPHQLFDLYDQYLSQRNWVQNGDFSSGNLAGWTYWQRGTARGDSVIMQDGESPVCRITRTTGGSFEDEDLVLMTANDWLRPNAQVRPGKNYRFFFSSRTTQETSQKFTVILALKGCEDWSSPLEEISLKSEIRETLVAQNEWRDYAMIVITPPDLVRRIQIGFRLADENLTGVQGDLLLKNVSLYEEQESDTLNWEVY